MGDLAYRDGKTIRGARKRGKRTEGVSPSVPATCPSLPPIEGIRVSDDVRGSGAIRKDVPSRCRPGDECSTNSREHHPALERVWTSIFAVTPPLCGVVALQKALPQLLARGSIRE